jgi:Predicted nucleic acid-binding protein, contains PIN domain
MLLDTSGLFCLFHTREPFHREALQAYEAAGLRFTHEFVLAELVALAHSRGAPRRAVLKFVNDLSASPEVELVWIDEALHHRPMALLAARLDKTYSLCDAVSFVLMRDRGIDQALTTDRHFAQEGFQKLLG